MNAKETLKKIAEALNILGESNDDTQDAAPVKNEDVVSEETPVVAEEAPVVAEEAPVEVVEDQPKEDVSEETPVKENEVIEAEESNKQELDRVAELEKQLNDLKDILKAAMTPEPTPVVEAPKEVNKGLTHSPEKPVAKQANGIGKKGESIQDRVFKYINNN